MRNTNIVNSFKHKIEQKFGRCKKQCRDQQLHMEVLEVGIARAYVASIFAGAASKTEMPFDTIFEPGLRYCCSAWK